MSGILPPEVHQVIARLAKDSLSSDALSSSLRALTSQLVDDRGDRAATLFGARIVERLGFGSDGDVYLLDNGWIMKSTASASESAFAAILSTCRPEELPRAIPSFAPYDVIEDKSSCEARYFFLRQDVRDMPDELDGMDREQWCEYMHHFEMAWTAKDRIALTNMMADCPLVADLIDALMWAEQSLGYSITDLKPDNLGWSGRNLVIRDFSRGTAAPILYELAAINGLEVRNPSDDPTAADMALYGQ